MNRDEILAQICSIADAALDCDSKVSECPELDSLTLLNVFVFLRKNFPLLGISGFIACRTVGEMIDLALGSAQEAQQ